MGWELGYRGKGGGGGGLNQAKSINKVFFDAFNLQVKKTLVLE